jgi:L-alanine-DL-glutamate epimerase-like enolase superfamily enzyme
VNPRIVSVKAWLVDVPLLSEWASSPEFGPHTAGPPRLILRLTDSDGFEGWGEGITSLRGPALREALARLPSSELDQWRPALLDLHAQPTYWHQPDFVSRFRPSPARMKHRLRHPLQCPVEMAVLDLIARRAAVPLVQLFGGAWRIKVPVDYWMGRVTPEHAGACVRRALQLGFKGIKLKTTLEDPNIERLEAILAEAGPDFSVTVDANGRFYRLDDASSVLEAMDRIGNMKVLEDPFPRHDYGAFAALRSRVRARIVAHIDPPESLGPVLRQDCVGGLNLDSHAQGLWGWKLQAAAADAFNLPVWHGSGLDLGVATAAQLHLAASAANCELAGDQAGPWLRQTHLLKSPFIVQDGFIYVPTGSGLGIEVDEAEVERFTIEKINL